MAGTSPTTPTVSAAGFDFWAHGIRDLQTRLEGSNIPLPPRYDPQCDLYRWVRAWRGDVDAIVPLYQEHLLLRRAMGLDGPTVDNADWMDPWGGEAGRVTTLTAMAHAIGLCDLGWDSNTTDVSPMDPSRLPLDNDGNIVTVMWVGRIDLKLLGTRFRSSDYFWFNFLAAERARRILLATERSVARPVGITVIYDLSGGMLGAKALVELITAGTPPLGPAVKAIQAHFPELTRRILVINAPAPIVDYVWPAIRPFLAERTRHKVAFLSSPTHLADHIPAHSLPTEYGGTYEGPIKFPAPRAPGPTAVIYPSLQEQPAAGLATAYVKPRERFVLTCPVGPQPHTHTTARWYFKTNGCLTFHVHAVHAHAPATPTPTSEHKRFLDPSGPGSGRTLVVPKLPLVASAHPEFGAVQLRPTLAGPHCDPSAPIPVTKYCMVWENNAGYFFSTRIEYRVTIVDGEGREKVVENNM